MSDPSNWQKLCQGEMTWDIFHFRQKIIQSIRRYFNTNHFLEIDPPYLTPYPTLDANIQSIETIYTDQSKKSIHLYLHTSPEHSMKKLLAAGAERIYFLGKVFRDGECTPLHNPEFTMCEWYRSDSDYTQLQMDVQQLITEIRVNLHLPTISEYLGHKIDFSLPWNCITLTELFKRETGHNLEEDTSPERLQSILNSAGIYFQRADSWETLFFRIFIELIEPKLGFPKPTFLVDYPRSLGMMAKEKNDNPKCVERVELYIAGLELANGYSELLDPREQKDRFLFEQRKKQIEMNKTYPMDTELISALEEEIPPSAGIALGVDRLVMLLTNTGDISDVLLFPFHSWLQK